MGRWPTCGHENGLRLVGPPILAVFLTVESGSRYRTPTVKEGTC